MTHHARIGDGLLALVLGSALAWALLGSAVIDPFDVSWLKSDPADSYIGWSFFRLEPTWHLPLLRSEALGYPLGVSTAYWDIIPPLALTFRLLSPLLPQDFQYFGPYGLACCVLQIYFGLRWTRRLAPARPLATSMAALFLGAAPPLMFRLYAGHFALASHWLILAALICLHDSRQGARVFPRLLVLIMLAAAINPYLLAMLLLVGVGVLANAGHFRGESVATLVAQLAALLGGSLAVMVVLGFITLGDSAYAGGGYIQCSMNLLAPIDPMTFRSILLPTQAFKFDRQYEGYNYLGLGLLSLGLAALIYRPALLRDSLADRFTAERAILVVALMLALSVYATVGSHTLYYVPVPDRVFQALASFRASGRLFWPGYYIVMGAILAAGLTVFPRRWGTVAIAVALVLQLADTASLQAATRARWADPAAPTPLHSALWGELGRYSRHLVVLPAWQCDPIKDNRWVTPGGVDGYQIFGNLALAQHMTLNSFYAPRVSEAQKHYFCRDQAADLAVGGPERETAYVFNPGDPLAARLAASPRARCQSIDGFVLCTPQ